MSDATSPKTLDDAVKMIEELTKQVNEATEKAETAMKHSRDWEDRAKANKDAAPKLAAAEKRIADLEAANLSEAEKLQRALTDLTAQFETEKAARMDADVKALRARIGAEKGLHPKLIPLLQGDDETSIATHAAELAEVATTNAGSLDIGQGQRGTPKTALKDPLAIALAKKTGAQV